MRRIIAPFALALVSPQLFAQRILLDLRGESPTEAFGRYVTGAGDVDLDGTQDILLSRREQIGGVRPEIQLVSGASGQSIHVWPLGDVFAGPQSDVLGVSFDSLQDADGDGRIDVVVSWVTAHEERVQVFSGATGSVIHEWIPTHPVPHVRGVGDIDADGYSDYLVAEPTALPNARGRVRALCGLSGEDLYATPPSGGSYDDFGSSLDVIGDIDGDGLMDWIAGGGWSSDYASVRSGADGSLIRHHQEGTGLAQFGSLVAGIGLFDGDDVPDYAVSQPNWNYGRIWTYSGATGQLIRRILTRPVSMSSADIDGDGFTELLTADIVQRLRVFDSQGETMIPEFHFENHVYRQLSPLAHSQLGDFDGDGADDILVGATGVAGYRSGSALILSLEDCNGNGRYDIVEVALGEPDCNGNWFPDTCDIASGWSLDLNGDGQPDECDCTPSTSLCDAVPNSIHPVGTSMETWGAPSVSQNDYTVSVRNAPDGELGVFLLGRPHQPIPFGDGTLCLEQVQRIATVELTANWGAAVAVDFGTLPALAIQPGETWSFQFWYRDPDGAGAGQNLSQARSQSFCP